MTVHNALVTVMKTLPCDIETSQLIRRDLQNVV